MRLAFFLDSGQIIEVQVDPSTVLVDTEKGEIQYKAQWSGDLPHHRTMLAPLYMDFSRVTAATLDGSEDEWRVYEENNGEFSW